MDNWVFVTGGSRGIGRVLVERFARSGRPVVFTYLSSREAAEALAAALSSDAPVEAVQCDGRDFAAMSALAGGLVDRHGAPGTVVNNAGITRDALMLQMTPEQWGEVIEGNLTSAFNATRAFLPAMIEAGGGTILQLSSVSGVKGNPGQANYSATKAGLIGFTRSLALEVARFNIRVNAIAPGLIETEMTQDLPAQELRALTRSIPMRRIGKAEEVAALAAFLAGEEAGYITGQTFVIDGGLSC
ncbi:MAG: 3-oxoacyl-ACP reductase FabG [Hyphomicrobiales bacterium]